MSIPTVAIAGVESPIVVVVTSVARGISRK